jgi:hypothetical protein
MIVKPSSYFLTNPKGLVAGNDEGDADDGNDDKEKMLR